MRPTIKMTPKGQSTVKTRETDTSMEEKTEIEHDNHAPRRKSKRHRTPCRKIKSPEIGSLYDILHDFSGSSLYVPPFGWSEQHTHILGRFVQRPPQKTPTPSTTSSPRRTPQSQTPYRIIEIGKCLDSMMVEGSSQLRQSNSIQAIIDTLFPNRLSRTTGELTMRCGNDRYNNAIRSQAMWKSARSPQSFGSTNISFSTSSDSLLTRLASSKLSTTDTSYDTPVLAYVSRSHLVNMRKNCFRTIPFPDGSFNSLIHGLQQLRSRKLIPKNPDEDQYILGTMIAMAQQHAYASVFSGLGYAPKDVRVGVITMSKEDASFIVYTAIIPRAFLDLFHYPDKAPLGDPKITVEYQRVPVWPVLGLKERLGQALGKDIVGEVDPTNMETFEDKIIFESDKLDKEAYTAASLYKRFSGDHRPVPNTPRATPPKRKVLSEVFNTSFSEDRDSSEFPSELLAKRRCLEEGRVGVVR